MSNQQPAKSIDAVRHVWLVWKIVGMDPPSSDGYVAKTLYTFYSILVHLAASVISPTIVFINVFLLTDSALLFKNVQASLTLVMSSLKQAAIYPKINNLRNANNYLKKLDKRIANDAAELRHIHLAVGQCQRMFYIVTVAFIFSLLAFSIQGFLNGQLPFEGWFPFDWTASSRNYHCAYWFQVLATIFQVIQNIGNDVYSTIYIHIINAHIHCLCLRIAKIGRNPSSTLADNYAELVDCIEDHKTIIEIFGAVTPVIATTVMLQFIITAIVLCVSIIRFVIFARELGQLILTFVYLTGILIECFPVCYFGNMLMEHTDRLTNAIYDCNWIYQDEKFRKSLIIFMQCSQRKCIILAGNLFPINLQTFISIIQFSFSLFTILNKIT